MKTLYPVLFTILLIPVLSLADQRVVPVQDIRTEDGDTLIINIEGREQRIQLAGIDAPEDVDNPKLQADIKRSQLKKEDLLKLGRVATEQLRYLLTSQAPFVLHFNPRKHDRYGRIPGDIVNARGESIAAQMISNGYAIANRRGSPAEQVKRLSALQSQALRQKNGLWGLYPDLSRRWGGVQKNASTK